MKCRACWTDKAYLRDDHGWKATLLSFLGVLPVKCHHCFHKAWVPWFATWGQQVVPPKIAEPTAARPSKGEVAQPVRRAA